MHERRREQGKRKKKKRGRETAKEGEKEEDVHTCVYVTWISYVDELHG